MNSQNVKTEEDTEKNEMLKITGPFPAILGKGPWPKLGKKRST